MRFCHGGHFTIANEVSHQEIEMKRNTRRLLTSLTCAFGIALTAASPVSAQQAVPMLTCPMGCGHVQTNTVLAAQMARADSNIMPAAQETPGFMYNIRVMAEESRWATTIFGTEDMVLQAAFQGGTPELERYVPEAIPIRFRLLYGHGHASQGKFFVTTNPEIKTIDDLKGKRIAIGLPTQSDWGMAAELILEHGHGINHDNTEIRTVGPAVLTQQLIDGHVDAALVALLTSHDRDVWWTGALTSRLEASGVDLYYLATTQEVVDGINDKLNMSLTTAIVPAGTLPNQTSDFLTPVNRIYEAAHETFPEEIAYEITMAAANFGKQFREQGLGFWRLWSPANMVAGLTEENVHPGAKRAFEELGWWESHTDYEPMTYPDSTQ
jgi:uncharacterized protein